ncbi:MAG: M28 family peptidase [bacterium]|nr:M28 family peptidase [bacterium]
MISNAHIADRGPARQLLLLGLLMTMAGAAAPSVAHPAAAALRSRVDVLCSPPLAGRAAGTQGGVAAADSLVSWYAAAGLQPAFAGDWRQRFPLRGEGWTGDALAGRHGTSVGALLPGAGSLAGRWLVVAAHLDHLGPVDPPAAGHAPAAGAYYPGANDNASGIVVVHELARRLRAAVDGTGGDRRGIIFLHPDAEEVGLQGAAWFVDHPPVPLDSIDVMVNLDTVGRLGDGRLIVSGIGTAAPLQASVTAAAAAAGVVVNPSRGGWSGSDHMVFNTREVPVLFLFGGPYPEYNRPQDAPDILDYDALGLVLDFTQALVTGLRDVRDPFTWVMVEGALRDDTGGAVAGNRQTWLGTMPDFTEGQAGYRIASVFADSPAEAAGLAKGDLMVSFGNHDVADLATFTTALRAYAPGDLVEIGVVRDGRRLRFTVALGDRAQRR